MAAAIAAAIGSAKSWDFVFPMAETFFLDSSLER